MLTNDIEIRTVEIGKSLAAKLDAWRPSLSERVQDRLMLTLMRRPQLRNAVLRLIDVLAAIPERERRRETAAIVREYLRPVLSDFPLWQRIPAGAATTAWLPVALRARLARAGIRFISGRFVLEPDRVDIDALLDEVDGRGRCSTVDLLGEEVLSEREAVDYKNGYLRLIERLSRHRLAGVRTGGGRPALEASIKLSALTHRFNPNDPAGTAKLVRPPLEELFDSARRAGIGINLDSELYIYRDLIARILEETIGPDSAFADWNDIGLGVQSYLRDTDPHIRDLVDLAERRGAPIGIRLVKGAYWDQEVIEAENRGWPVPVYRDKAETDLAWERAAETILESSPALRLAVASHNIRTHALGEALREAHGVPEGEVEHQTLLRTLDGLSQALVQIGWPERDYVPVGELIPGMSYLVRRILENTAPAGCLIRRHHCESSEELLGKPQPGDEDGSYRRTPDSFGFLNAPAARLFDSGERSAFERELERVRSAFGEELVPRVAEAEIRRERPTASHSPSHPGEVVAWIHEAEVDDADRAVAAANEAAAAWAAVPVEERERIGMRAAELLHERRWTAGAWVVHEGGRAWEDAMADVEESVDHIEWNARRLRELDGLAGRRVRPRGVVACIPPWNFPTALPAGMTSAALLCGNAVILKPAEQTAGCAKLLADIFHEAGVPERALIWLPGAGETVGARLVENAGVDMVAFTGSKAVGLEICRSAARVRPEKGGIRKVVTEMGGKNPILVFPDADMDEAVDAILSSAFVHAGQKCSACSRVIAHRDIIDRLRERLVEAARSLPCGPADDPATVVNPVIDEEARQRVAGYAEIAAGEGEVLLALGATAGPGTNPNLLAPMIYELSPSAARSARTAREEIFGPVLALIPFSTEEEAIDLANDVPYGLTFGVFSRSPRTIARIVDAADAGHVYVNRKITASRVGIEPFGGHKLSGTGPKAGGSEYLSAFVTRTTGFRRSEGRSGRETASAAEPADGDLPPGRGPVPDGGANHRAGPPGGARQAEPPRRVADPARAATWRGESAAERLVRLDDALHLLRAFSSPPQLEDGREIAGPVETAGRAVLEAAAEVVQPQPAVRVPGQRNTIRWDLPLGIGLVAADDGADPGLIAGYLFGALLAGNGVIVALPPGWRALGTWLYEVTREVRVPAGVVTLAAEGTSPAAIAATPIHFAAVDLAIESTQSLQAALSDTREDAGQRYIKRLIHAADDLHPGERGFIRQFAHPKAVSVRTLRHGADLPPISGARKHMQGN